MLYWPKSDDPFEELSVNYGQNWINELIGHANFENFNISTNKSEIIAIKNSEIFLSNFERAVINNSPIEDSKFDDCNFSSCNFCEAKIKNTIFKDCNFSNAILKNVSLENVTFLSCNLDKTKFSEETIIKHCTFPCCTFNDSELKIIMFSISSIDLSKTNKDYIRARLSYMSLKKYFTDENMQYESSIYYIQEKAMERKILFQKIFKPDMIEKNTEKDKFLKRIFIKIKYLNAMRRNFLYYIQNWLLNISCRYGEKTTLVFAWWLVIILSFAGYYYNSGTIINGKDTPIKSIPDALYFSTVTFTTLGYGDFKPVNDIAKLLCGTEALLGAVFIALFIFVLSRKMSR